VPLLANQQSQSTEGLNSLSQLHVQCETCKQYIFTCTRYL